jgi:WD40 repeat protein
VNATLAGPLEHIVNRSMARDAGRRYQTAAELAADLQRFLDGRRTVAADAVAALDDVASDSSPAPDIDWRATVEGVRVLAADPAGRFVAAGLASGAIELRHCDTGALVETIRADHGAVLALTFTADGHIVAAWDDGTMGRVRFAGAGC